jgi:spermidine synthase
MMASASQRLDPAEITSKEIDARLQWRGVKSLKYYNGRMHNAAMALPNFVSRAIAGTGVRRE